MPNAKMSVGIGEEYQAPRGKCWCLIQAHRAWMNPCLLICQQESRSLTMPSTPLACAFLSLFDFYLPCQRRIRRRLNVLRFLYAGGYQEN